MSTHEETPSSAKPIPANQGGVGDEAPPAKPIPVERVTAEEEVTELPQPEPQGDTSNKKVETMAEETKKESRTPSKKAAAKKSSSAPKKTAAKKSESSPKKTAAKKSESSDKLSVEEVAEALLDGATRWGTGRDRDTNLANEGYDLNELRKAGEAARAKRMGASES